MRSHLCAFIACRCVLVTSFFLLHLFYFCMLITGIGRVSYGAFLGRCEACECLISFHYPSVSNDVIFFPFFSYLHDIFFNYYAPVHLFHCRVTNLLHQKQHLNESKAFPLLMKLCYSHPLSQIFHSSRPGLSCGKSPPLHWSAVFLSTSSNT